MISLLIFVLFTYFFLITLFHYNQIINLSILCPYYRSVFINFSIIISFSIFCSYIGFSNLLVLFELLEPNIAFCGKEDFPSTNGNISPLSDKGKTLLLKSLTTVDLKDVNPEGLKDFQIRESKTNLLDNYLRRVTSGSNSNIIISQEKDLSGSYKDFIIERNLKRAEIVNFWTQGDGLGECIKSNTECFQLKFLTKDLIRSLKCLQQYTSFDASQHLIYYKNAGSQSFYMNVFFEEGCKPNSFLALDIKPIKC